MSSPGTLSTDDPSSMSCTYVSHGHHGNAHEQNCSVGAWPFQPKSWAMTDAFCSVFHDDTCKLDIKEQIKYNSSQSCINAQSGMEFNSIGSLRCSANTPSCRACIKCRTACLDLVGQDEAYFQ